MNNNFDKDMDNILNKEVNIPKSILDKKELAFNAIKSNKNKRRKPSWKTGLTAALVTLTVLGGIAFGDNALASIKNYLNLNKDYGYEKAVNKGHVQNVNSKVVSKNGVDIKLMNIVKDSNRICTTFSIKVQDSKLFKEIVYIKPNLTYTGGILESMLSSTNYNYSVNNETQEIIINSVSTFNPNNSQDNIKNLNNLDNIDVSISSLDILTSVSNNVESFKLPEVSEGDKNNMAKAGLKLIADISGPWEFKVAIDKKFNNTKPIEFTQSNNKDYITIVSAKMLPTGIDITYTFKNEAEAKNDELYKKFKSIKLVDNKQNIYTPTNYALQELRDDNTTYITQTFPATIFDEIDSLKIIIKDNNNFTKEVILNK
ncbi:MAG: DUF4179 domain-containing protein [Clostridium sp.]|uniref:DUF4179 domain-containing protein n=1 Tax=Clostridium sp. TaxID=1506 RepID=UPI002FCB74CD